MADVAIVSLGRARAMGEVRRVQSWRAIFEAAGAEVHEVAVASSPVDLRGVPAVLTGTAAPERLAWSGRRLRRALDRIDPDVVISISTRAFDIATIGPDRTIVLDFVDSLSRSYHDRSEIVTGRAERWAYRALAAGHRRVERRLRAAPVIRVAAGWADADTLHATWVPNVCAADAGSLPASAAPERPSVDHDLIFFGTLRYPPNVDALDRLARMWPRLIAARPGTTALVAGAAPTDHVRTLCRRHDWELVEDFLALAPVIARARLSVVPLLRTAGIQNKVLEAATLGVPQVVTTAALAGFEPGFPLLSFDDDAAFVAETVRLLDDPAARATQVARAREHVAARYTAAAWYGWASEVVSAATSGAH